MDTGYKVSDIMAQNVLTAVGRKTLREAASLMADKRIGSLVIVDDNKAVKGIITEQDFARKVVAKGVDASSSFVSEVMSVNVVTISPHEDLYTAMVRMGKHDIKHLPVINSGKLVGILSFKDIIRVEPALIEKISFKNKLRR